MAHSANEQLANLQRACLELSRGFERAAESDNDEELVITLHEASYALVEVHRATDTLTQSLQAKEMRKEPPKVYELRVKADEMPLWRDEELRKMIIRGGIEEAKNQDCRLLRVLDSDGQQLHLEGFGPRLWDMVARVHEGLDEIAAEMQNDVRALHLLVRDALDAFQRGDITDCHAAIKAAMDKEYELCGDIVLTGDDELLQALGYDLDKEAG